MTVIVICLSFVVPSVPQSHGPQCVHVDDFNY